MLLAKLSHATGDSPRLLTKQTYLTQTVPGGEPPSLPFRPQKTPLTRRTEALFGVRSSPYLRNQGPHLIDRGKL